MYVATDGLGTSILYSNRVVLKLRSTLLQEKGLPKQANLKRLILYRS